MEEYWYIVAIPTALADDPELWEQLADDDSEPDYGNAEPGYDDEPDYFVNLRPAA